MDQISGTRNKPASQQLTKMKDVTEFFLFLYEYMNIIEDLEVKVDLNCIVDFHGSCFHF